MLKQISESYGAIVEASARDRSISIISDYETSRDIVNLIILTLEGIQSTAANFPSHVKSYVGPLSRRKATYQAIIQGIMQLTGTIIKEASKSSENEDVSVECGCSMLLTNR